MELLRRGSQYQEDGVLSTLSMVQDWEEEVLEDALVAQVMIHGKVRARAGAGRLSQSRGVCPRRRSTRRTSAAPSEPCGEDPRQRLRGCNERADEGCGALAAAISASCCVSGSMTCWMDGQPVTGGRPTGAAAASICEGPPGHSRLEYASYPPTLLIAESTALAAAQRVGSEAVATNSSPACLCTDWPRWVQAPGPTVTRHSVVDRLAAWTARAGHRGTKRRESFLFQIFCWPTAPRSLISSHMVDTCIDRLLCASRGVSRA